MLSRVTSYGRMLALKSIAQKMKNASLFMGFVVLIVLTSNLAYAESRIKDLVSFEGVRQNQLVGYGLVVGLNGTGDLRRQVYLDI